MEKKCFKWIVIILLAIFAAFFAGYSLGVFSTLNWGVDVAMKQLNISVNGFDKQEIAAQLFKRWQVLR